MTYVHGIESTHERVIDEDFSRLIAVSLAEEKKQQDAEECK